MKFTWTFKMESKSFTFYSHNSMKDELVNLTENQLQELRAFYVERYVDNMATKDLVQYVMDDMIRLCLQGMISITGGSNGKKTVQKNSLL